MSENITNGFSNLESGQKKKLEEYIENLMDYNRKLNIMSRKIGKRDIEKLIEETMLLEKLITNSTIIDFGSGNGILGIPIAIMNRQKEIKLVESKIRKVNFLGLVIKNMLLKNVEVYNLDIKEYFRKNLEKRATLVARGFPKNEMLYDFIRKGFAQELVIITSKNKIKKNKKNLENMDKNIYNIFFRDNLVILKIKGFT